MRFTPFTSGEKKLLVAALVVACLVGNLVAYVAYVEEENAQFHGGVLEENAAEARFALFWAAASAFAQWSIGSLLVFGIAPIGVRRLLRRGHGDV